MITTRNGRRAATAALLILAASACGGAATPAPMPAAPTPPPPEAASTRSRPAAPTEAEVAPPTLGEHEHALLCGPGRGTAGAASFDAVARQVQEGDRALAEKAARARAATDAGCRDAVDALDNVFQQLAASSRTLCDYQLARGIGVAGEELVARTSALLTAIDDRVATIAAIASGDDKACPAQASRLAADVERWRDQRSRICAVTREQRAVSACGVEATDTGQKQRAKSYCDALAANGLVDAQLSRPIEQCVAQALRAED